MASTWTQRLRLLLMHSNDPASTFPGGSDDGNYFLTGSLGQPLQGTYAQTLTTMLHLLSQQNISNCLSMTFLIFYCSSSITIYCQCTRTVLWIPLSICNDSDCLLKGMLQVETLAYQQLLQMFIWIIAKLELKHWIWMTWRFKQIL